MSRIDIEKRLEKRISAKSSAIRALSKLNKKFRFNLSYSHSVACLRIVNTQEELDKILKELAIKTAQEITAPLFKTKEGNQKEWKQYKVKVASVLESNIFSEKEARKCNIPFDEYSKKAMLVFSSRILKEDSEPIECTLRYGLLGKPEEYKEFFFSEEELQKGFLDSVSKSSAAKDIQEPGFAKINPPLDESNQIELQPESPSELSPNDSDLSEPIGSADGGESKAAKPDQNGGSNLPEPLESGASQKEEAIDPVAERRKAIRNAFDSDPGLAKLRKLYESDETFPGLIAKELVYAKEEIDS